MIIVYRVPGFVAGVALVIYVCLDLIALNAFDLTLTLQGIAGIILSIGMAVDANVIIYAPHPGGDRSRKKCKDRFEKTVLTKPFLLSLMEISPL